MKWKDSGTFEIYAVKRGRGINKSKNVVSCDTLKLKKISICYHESSPNQLQMIPYA